MMKQALMVAAIAVSATAANAQVTVLAEGFDNVAGLSGWTITNDSKPIGPIAEGWFQGSVFDGQAGGFGSYIASNYLVADPDKKNAKVDTWLITPLFSFANNGSVSFWAKSDLLDGYADTLEFGLLVDGKKKLMYGDEITVKGDWTQYSFNFLGLGGNAQAQFAIHYAGKAADLNNVGVDSLVITAVPEPSTWLMLALGLAGVGVVARRRNA